MDEIDEKLFASLKGVWTEEEKEEARSFYDVGGEPELTTLYAYDALKESNITIPQPLGRDLYEALDFADIEGDPYYEALNSD